MSAVYSTSQALFPEYLLPAFIFVSFVLLSYAPRWYYLLRYKLPPGPVCLPFVGYLPILNKDTGHISGIKLAEKYGNIVSLYVGSKLVVILNDHTPLKDAYNKEDFLNRPDTTLEVACGQPSVLDANGVLWKEQRRFLVTCLRQLGTGNKNFESYVMELISEVCSSLRSSRGNKINLDHEIELAINNITFYFIYGKKFEASHPMIRSLSEYGYVSQVQITKNMLRLFFPWLANLKECIPWTENIRKTQEKMDEIIREEIEEHQKTLNADEPRDLIDYFLINMDKTGSGESFNMKVLFGSVKMLLSASSETTKISLTWFFLIMAKHQDVQRNIHNEIDAHLGMDGEAKYSDRDHLPYTEAAIWESMRLYNLLHWNILRSTPKDTTLCGFDIPRNSVIMHNMTSQFHNPEHFDKPDVFDPTRFLTPDGKKVHLPEHFVPFSYGKRNCLGDKSASLVLFLFSTTLLQHFDVLPPTDGLCFKQKTVLGNMATSPFVRFKARV